MRELWLKREKGRGLFMVMDWVELLLVEGGCWGVYREVLLVINVIRDYVIRVNEREKGWGVMDWSSYIDWRRML